MIVKRNRNYQMISVHKEHKDMLDEMRRGAIISYSDIVFYLLAKSGHLIVDGTDDELKFKALDDFINGERYE
jgi:hypothetical protein